jgi:hypothetical protein
MEKAYVDLAATANDGFCLFIGFGHALHLPLTAHVFPTILSRTPANPNAYGHTRSPKQEHTRQHQRPHVQSCTLYRTCTRVHIHTHQHPQPHPRPILSPSTTLLRRHDLSDSNLDRRGVCTSYLHRVAPCVQFMLPVVLRIQFAVQIALSRLKQRRSNFKPGARSSTFRELCDRPIAESSTLLMCSVLN